MSHPLNLLCEVSLEVFGKSNTALNDLILSPSQYVLVGKVFGQVSFFTMGTRWDNFISEYWALVSCQFVELTNKPDMSCHGNLSPCLLVSTSLASFSLSLFTLLLTQVFM